VANKGIREIAARILAELWDKNCSLEQLRLAVGTSAPTLQRELHKLQKAELVSIVGCKPPVGGRPAILYGMDCARYLSFGIHIELPEVYISATDLCGIAHYREYREVNDVKLPDQLIPVVTSLLSELRSKFYDRKILGVGVALPGYIDRESGTILSIAREPGWENVQIKHRIESATDLNVMIENDINCMASTEIYRSKLEANGDFAYVGLIEGVKASIFLNCQVYEGPFGNAGHLGHIPIVSPGDQCHCGNVGCLETVASVHGVCDTYDRTAECQDPRGWSQKIMQASEPLDKFELILKAADNGYERAQETVTAMIDGLAVSLVSLVSIVQPKLLILGGALTLMTSNLRSKLESKFRNHLLPILSNNLAVRWAQFAEPGSAAIGASLLFSKMFLTRSDSIEALLRNDSIEYGEV